MEKSIKTNVALNIIKQCCGTLFPLITFSYASHVLGESGIGQASFSQTTVSYLSLIATLGLQSYGIKEGTKHRDRKNDFSRFASELFTINTIMMLIAYLILGLLLCFWTYLESYRNVILIYSCTILLNTVGADWVNSVYEDYLYLTVRYVVVQIVCLAALVIFVQNSGDVLQYVFISMISAAGGALFNIAYVRRYVKLRLIFSKSILIHIRPMLYLFGSSLAVIVYVNSDISMITVMKGDSAAGIYTAATKIYQAVKHMLFAVVTVIIPRMSYLIAEKRFEVWKALLLKIENFLLIIILPTITGLILMSKNILTLFAGSGFRSGATALSILSLALVFAVISNILVGAVLLPFNQERANFVITLIACIANVGLNLIMIPYYGMAGAALTTLIAEMINAVGSAVICRFRIFTGIKKKTVMDSCLGVMSIVAVCTVIKSLGTGIITETVLSISFGMAVYAGMLLGRKNEEVINILLHFKLWRD